MTWHIAPDPNTDEPTLWHGDKAILRRHDLSLSGWGVSTREDRDRVDVLLDLVWSVLTSVLAPDEAKVERLAAAGARGEGMDWGRTMDGGKEYFRANTRAVLAALAAAPDPDGGQDEGVSG